MLASLQNRDAPRDIDGAQMYVNRSPVSQRPQFAFENAQARIEFLDGLRNLAGDHPIAPFDPLMLQIGTGQIDGAALPRPAGLRRRVLRVNHASAKGEARAATFAQDRRPKVIQPQRFR